MREPAFTPGPWTVRPVFVAEDTLFRKAGEPTGEWEVVYEDDQKELGEDPWFIADIHDEAPGSAEANARAVAAVPDMVELLCQYRDDLRHPPEGDSRERRLERVCEVLSLALGEKQDG